MSRHDASKETQENEIKLASNFEVANVEEALTLISGLKREEFETTRYFDTKKSVSNKILETLITSPVFYNLSLLPNFRFKYTSQFRRSCFSDNEKMWVQTK